MHFLKCLKDLIDFMSLPKDSHRIVFYSEGAHDWIHLEGLIHCLLSNHSVSVCYISSSQNDPGLDKQHPRFKSFMTDEHHVRNWLFKNIDTPLFVMTTPDLNQFQLKKSRHNVCYAFVQHSLVSLHMAYRKGAFDHYDIVFCAGPHHVKELRAIETVYKLPPKKIIEHGYGRLDSLMRMKQTNRKNDLTTILIAPSWGEHSIIHTVGDLLISTLLQEPYAVILRPHPHTIKHAKHLIKTLQRKFKNNTRFVIETDISKTDSLYTADLMVTDWSGSALDFAFCNEKPVIYINTPRKINNPDYCNVNSEPFEASSRSMIGTIVAPVDIPDIGSIIKKALEEPCAIKQFRQDNVYNLGNADETGAAGLINILGEINER